jgi:hypothetical protein
MTTQTGGRGVARLLLGALFTLLALPAWAEIAGTGTFDIDVDGFPPSVTFDGNITFDNASFMVGGMSVNLGTSVGTMTYSGNATVNTAALSATFDVVGDDPNSAFGFTGAGGGACQGACVGGTATFAGALDSVSGGVLPPGFTYTFDGTVAINFLGMGPGGTVAINAFAAVPTGTGTDVPVGSGATTYFDTRADANASFDIALVFDQVTVAGDTTFVGLTAIPGTIPGGITLNQAVSRFVDIVTSAGFTGMIDICFNYPDANMDGIVDGTSISIALLRLLHASAAGSAFSNVTTTTGNGQVCGTVGSLSPVVVGVAQPTTTTTTTTLGTTTTAPGGTTTTTPASTTTTTTLPLGNCATPTACVDVALSATLCGSEQINPKLQKAITKGLGKAKKFLGKAAGNPAKAEKFVGKARKQLDNLDKKATAFVSKKKGPISADCRDDIAAALDQIGQAITDNPPAGG